MIHRTAENCFWLQIHLLRAKSNAQFLVTCHESYLDGHHSLHLLERHPLIVEAGYTKINDSKNDTKNLFAKICDHLTWDPDCENSIYNNLKKGRSNAHMIRVLLSEKAWNALNHTWLWLNAPETRENYKKNRIDFYHKIISFYHTLEGILEDNMRRDNAYHYMQIGTLLEKLESHSKILDLSANFIKNHPVEHDEVFWGTILDAFDGRDPFNSFFGQDVATGSTLSFLLMDRYFPHSILYSLLKLEESLKFVGWSKSKSIDQVKAILDQINTELKNTRENLIITLPKLTVKLIDEINILFNDIREQYSKE